MYNQIDSNLDHNLAPKRMGMKKNMCRILLVEDDLFWQDLISFSLKSFYGALVTIRCAKSFHHADNLIFTDHFDLIICDHILQGSKTGLDLWRSLRQNQVFIPMIMLSAADPKNTQEKEINELSLQKPIFIKKSQFGVSYFGSLMDCYIGLPRMKLKVQAKESDEVIPILPKQQMNQQVKKKSAVETSNTKNLPELQLFKKTKLAVCIFMLITLYSVFTSIGSKTKNFHFDTNIKVKQNSKFKNLITNEIKQQIQRIAKQADAIREIKIVTTSKKESSLKKIKQMTL